MSETVSTAFWALAAVVRSWCTDAVTAWWVDADRGWQAVAVAGLVAGLVQAGVAVPW